MIPKLPVIILFSLSLSLAGYGQEKKNNTPVQIRAVLHAPIQTDANLFYKNQKGAVVPLEFRLHSLTRPLLTLPVDGSFLLFDNASVEPENLSASIAASVKLPSNTRRFIAIVLPAPEETKPAYRILLINDTTEAFPKGESRVIPLINVKIGIQAGEHKLRADPGKITRIPPVTRVDDYNMAQTNFHYLRDESWIVFTERRLQYHDAYRRLFIVSATPGSVAPSVTTIVDTTTPAARNVEN